jgi:hypothetical protein
MQLTPHTFVVARAALRQRAQLLDAVELMLGR